MKRSKPDKGTTVSAEPTQALVPQVGPIDSAASKRSSIKIDSDLNLALNRFSLDNGRSPTAQQLADDIIRGWFAVNAPEYLKPRPGRPRVHAKKP